MSSDSKKQKLIQPRTLRGFRDFTPEMMIPRERLIETAKGVYRSYGFSPIDTPALELTEILLGKGGNETDKQMYRFEDNGGRDVAMRFDLTVPLARFAAQHIGQLGTPFKRYHIATVWRGENTQRGRYREFMQCDFDTIGTTSISADIETVLVIHDLMRAIGFEKFSIQLNNRKVLSGLLQKLDLQDCVADVLRAIDKLAKIGPEKVMLEMCETAKTSKEQAVEIMKFAEISGSNDEVLAAAEKIIAGNEIGEQGIDELRQVLAATESVGIEKNLKLNISIARGLDYYTGTIVETFLTDLPGIGSVCSGGRYDNLAELYTKQSLPGIGASLGLDRLLAAMEELELIEKVSTPADVMIVYFDKQRLHDYLKIAQTLRAGGIRVELYPEPKKLAQQLKYADRRGFRAAIIVGSNEFSDEVCQLKDLQAGESETISLKNDAQDVVTAIRKIL